MPERYDKVNLNEAKAGLADDITQKAMLARPLPEWRPILAQECQVYVLGENYIGKRFDQINFKYCEEYEAQEIVTNNIYALLRTKYFKKPSEESDQRIQEIVKSFNLNLMTTLMKVSLNDDTDCTKVSFLPSSCIAFRNGVYDFKKDAWLFKYQIIKMPLVGNKMYVYAADWLIMWYLDFDFDPLPFNVTTTKGEDVVALFRTMCKDKKTQNLCFELMSNIAHDVNDKFDMDRFWHLCEIVGYVLLQDFSQSFVILIGAGSNGKNSLFDGCFTSHVIPTPTSNSLEDIEKDRFITGALENKAHNIFLETSASIHSESKMLKQLTGSMYQTIESKGISKYSGIINCKYIFSGNDQDKIKFSDSTTGFRRRINLFEIYYTWDAQKRFMKKGDYYDTTFSEDLHEVKNDIGNAVAFCYFGMMGIAHATANFTKSFKFTQNDWKLKYSDVDMDIKDEVEGLTAKQVSDWLKKRPQKDKEANTLFYDTTGVRLVNSKVLSDLGYVGTKGIATMLANDEECASFFSENDIFISSNILKMLIADIKTTMAFNSGLKKIWNLTAQNFRPMFANTMYIKCTFISGKLKIVE